MGRAKRNFGGDNFLFRGEGVKKTFLFRGKGGQHEILAGDRKTFFGIKKLGAFKNLL